MVKDSLGDRMKRYESVTKGRLVSRMPVIMRLDGCHFHTFCRGFVKPFDDVLIRTMQSTMDYLCKSIQGCVLGYTQSDEITLVLVDYEKINTSAWFDNEIEKMCSVAASMATFAFNKNFEHYAKSSGVSESQMSVYLRAIEHGATFDCRVFNVPQEDVENCLIWRQQDAVRNSIQAVAQSQFSCKEMFKKSCNELQDMLHEQRGINWNDLETIKKRGSCCIKVGESFIPEGHEVAVTRMIWVIDNEIPVFTQDRNYIRDLIFFNEE